MISLASIVFSSVLLGLLGVRDPKRVRHAARESSSTARPMLLPTPVRTLCGWLVIVPGVLLAAFGEWWAFLIWFGATPALGWLIAMLLARGQPPDVSRWRTGAPR